VLALGPPNIHFGKQNAKAGLQFLQNVVRNL
jgi:hypothetical protein